jgi:hypothetical protein
MKMGKTRCVVCPLSFYCPRADKQLRSINFNVVSKGQGSQKMSFYLNEAAGDIRDLLMPTLEPPKAKL